MGRISASKLKGLEKLMISMRRIKGWRNHNMFLSEGCIFCLKRKDHSESLETQCEFNRTVVKDIGQNFVDNMSDNLSRQFGFKSSSNHIDSVYCRITTFEGHVLLGPWKTTVPQLHQVGQDSVNSVISCFVRQKMKVVYWCKHMHLCRDPWKSINVLLKYRSTNCTKVWSFPGFLSRRLSAPFLVFEIHQSFSSGY